MSAQTDQLGKLLTASFITRAMLKDYAKVVAKIEGGQPEEVEKRVTEEAEKLRLQFVAETQTLKEQQSPIQTDI